MLQLVQAAGLPREELDPPNHPPRVDGGPLVMHAVGKLGCARGPYRGTRRVLVREQQLSDLAVSGHQLPGGSQRLEDRYRPQPDAARFGQDPCLPHKVREPSQRIALVELVTELDIAVECLAHGIGSGLELSREKALVRPAFEQSGARPERHRDSHTECPRVQRRGLAVGAEL